MTGHHEGTLPPWLKFLDETSKVLTGVTAITILYTRSVGIAYFGAGALACTLGAKAIKKAIRQQRPVGGHRKKISYGMPSTHASGATFYMTYVPLACMYLEVHRSLPLWAGLVAPAVVVPWMGAIMYSRVTLGHHTWAQVAGGFAWGVLAASVWFVLWSGDAGGVQTLGAALEVWAGKVLAEWGW
ncbi:hypothetical protein CONPUDRAFT_97984 [Coniophora puteana RWD-64-598 SS2]|uniref:Phosphatidic acid phosphatase type 2/haloperoxidase domain-containing protein n=1 Tax=Coniophora puteana (strain RWD-64-598) TaxID=741705 RepID=A0A5M3N1B5_CONPW|nr:uncharacterized protein CONPUDRAFT_97984 [Coniophora puteana RWD-64-598 SS2]EIW85179.1 hypothetical protein CONPUDRAFT_97984 [Coniophora puteana RWD-64-598 SS2]